MANKLSSAGMGVGVAIADHDTGHPHEQERLPLVWGAHSESYKRAYKQMWARLTGKQEAV